MNDQSEPTASLERPKTEQSAPEPLGSTACCASSFDDSDLEARRRIWFDEHMPRLIAGEICSKQWCDMFIEAGLANRTLTLDDYYKDKEWCDAMIAETNERLARQS